MTCLYLFQLPALYNLQLQNIQIYLNAHDVRLEFFDFRKKWYEHSYLT